METIAVNILAARKESPELVPKLVQVEDSPPSLETDKDTKTLLLHDLLHMEREPRSAMGGAMA